MIVILTQDVKGKGKAGDVVKVNDGYARNMLLPKGLAKEATQGNVRSLEKQKALAEEKRQEQKAAAQKQAEKLEKLTVTIQSKGGENGKLFGSVTAKEVAENVKKQFGVETDKRKITMEDVKSYGTYEAEIKLYPGISAKIYVQVSE